MAAYIYFLDMGAVMDQVFVCRIPPVVSSYYELEMEVRRQLQLEPHFLLLHTKCKLAMNCFAEFSDPPPFKSHGEFQLAFGTKKMLETCPDLPLKPEVVAQAHGLMEIKKEILESEEEVVWLPNPREPKVFKIPPGQDQPTNQPSTSAAGISKFGSPPFLNEYNFVDSKMDQRTMDGERVPPASSTVEIQTTPIFAPPYTSTPISAPRGNIRRFTAEERRIQEELKKHSLIKLIMASPRHAGLLYQLEDNQHPPMFYTALSEVLAWYIVQNSPFHTKATAYPIVEHLLRPHPTILISHLFGPDSFRLVARFKWVLRKLSNAHNTV
ncbi:unnamed protein product [Bursaphelenchus xylophilus]|uniref:(pine wood nematode) hypothetical protein n=1 Tax=Bursaphelenchus xylophilus TaxID=6326 RepID=A0A1I7RW92_BURXY|nr:unnamed protein product [Bursaphelenchus xylophilus]CAG9095302.1 unnamed protein product [Bursaphelenchus xylophilus]